MKYAFFLLAIFVGLTSCKREVKTVEGDLYFKLIDPYRVFDAPDSVLKKIETTASLVNENDEWLKFMVEKGLLRKPFIRIIDDNGEINIVFLNPTDYEKIKDYNQNELIIGNKKIRVRVEGLDVHHKSLKVYETSKLIAIEQLDGKTQWKK